MSDDPRSPGPQPLAARPPDPLDGEPPASDPLTDRIAAGMLGALRLAGLAILSAVHFGLALPALLANLDGYRHAWVQLTAFGLLTLIIVVDALLGVAGRRRPRPWVAAGLVCSLVAAVVATSQLPGDHYLATPHWTFLEIGWFGVLLLFDAGLNATLLFLGIHVVVTLGQLTLAGIPSRQAAAGMAVSALAICAFQIAAAVMAKLLRGCATTAGATAREQERVRTEAAVSAQVHADQRSRYRDLGRSVLPLLTGLADGTLDPGDERVRRRCAFEAARLRRLFAERDHASDPLLHELRAGIGVAERHGVDVQLAVRGVSAPVPRHLRRALTEPVLAALATAERSARATVVRGGGQVRVSVVTDAPETDIPEPTERGVRVRTVHSEGRLLVEASYTLLAPSPAGDTRTRNVPNAQGTQTGEGTHSTHSTQSTPSTRGVQSSSSEVSPS
ncbi:hypothetical protein [Streptomyces sp. 35G-GA-8]|uniref:hypothetical protein n=1 Tax=Streptomyces sp. 35G-GA-8 TaxID=2939434 RepID=UPI00201EC9A9|nr:hypothetical protein [Streptomyces sp. 35G-GA-8]MCL7381616.1 hypothetical protein [Streptomyces sp. 35G-GA-8]